MCIKTIAIGTVLAALLVGMHDSRTASSSMGLAAAAAPSARLGRTEAAGDVVLQDDFSSPASGWEVSGDANYHDGAYNILASDADTLVWALAHREALNSIHLEVTVSNVRAVPDASFGFICNYVDENNFTMLGIGSDGHYAIIRFDRNKPTYLTSGKAEWPFSAQIKPGAASYRLGADCSRQVLSLSVDGISIASVQGMAFDMSFAPGDIGLFALANDYPKAEMRFDDMVVTKLQPN